jgi:hypothetical protein
MTTRDPIRPLLRQLATAFDRPLADARIDLYSAALSDLPFELLADACATAIRECRFFPRVAELRLIADRLRNERAPRKLLTPIDTKGQRAVLCPRCDDTGWQWHLTANGPPCETSLEAVEKNARYVSQCACASANPVVIRRREVDARYVPRYGTGGF